MRPSDLYLAQTQQSGFHDDPAQRHAVFFLDGLWQELEQATSARSRRRLPGWLLRYCTPAVTTPQGVYLWGGVGRGKTFLMDLLLSSLPGVPSLRQHFHQFMGRIHQLHDQYRAADGDPVTRIADELAREIRLLCLDEFEVKDIGDAMLIGRLLEALFERGLVLVVTSNTPPERLYDDGLQRARFVPAIHALLQHCRVVSLDGGTDYRSRVLREAGLFHHPHDEQTIQRIHAQLHAHLIHPVTGRPVIIQGREIATRLQDVEILWFDFEALCGGPRSRFDYLEIARRCKTLVLTGVPCMDDEQADWVRRFISLIDILYDRRIKLILSSCCPIESIYTGDFLDSEFCRTRSRLLEMQGERYLSTARQG